jgi:hypothetical protein
LLSGAPAKPAPMPAPTHAQTVAMLRHSTAVLNELRQIAKNPELGKDDLKREIIDGTTKLVSQLVISPTDAVKLLTGVPDTPYQQKVWVATQMHQTELARALVLGHHALAFRGVGPLPNPSADQHQTDMAGVVRHYGGRRA